MEMLGMKSIIEAIESGTLHSLALPPERHEFPSDAAYDSAYAKWLSSQRWRASTAG